MARNAQRVFEAVLISAVLVLVAGNVWIEWRAFGRIFSDSSRVPAADVGLAAC